jgi:hypothetical protein
MYYEHIVNIYLGLLAFVDESDFLLLDDACVWYDTGEIVLIISSRDLSHHLDSLIWILGGYSTAVEVGEDILLSSLCDSYLSILRE